MNEQIRELKKQAWEYAMAVHDGHIVPPLDKEVWPMDKVFDEKFAELMIMEFCDVVKSTANELNEHYIREGCSEEEVLMRVNGALAVLGHIRERFKD